MCLNLAGSSHTLTVQEATVAVPPSAEEKNKEEREDDVPMEIEANVQVEEVEVEELAIDKTGDNDKQTYEKPEEPSIIQQEAAALTFKSQPSENKEIESMTLEAKSAEKSKRSTRALRIDGFVRPCAETSVRELLCQCGELKAMWMPSIKTHCYAIFGCIQEAEAAMRALSGLQWPSGSPKRLEPVFVSVQSAEKAIVNGGDKADFKIERTAEDEEEEKEEEEEEPLPKEDEALLERKVEKNLKAEAKVPEEQKGISLDDIFKKTSTKPALYWLPLTEEQVASKKK